MTDKIKILHCSDLHLGSELAFLKGKAKSRRAEILRTLENIISICASQSIELLAISGDLFDSNHIDQNTIVTVKKLFSSVPDTIIAVCAGNHDYFAVDSPYCEDGWSENVVIFDSAFSKHEFPDKNLRLCGSSFTSSYQVSENSISVPDDEMINILVYHGDVVSENTESKYNPITVSQIKSSLFDYVALGHIHTASAVETAGKTSYAYSGTPDGCGFDETGEKGVYIGYVYKQSVSLEFYKTSSRLFCTENIDVSKLSTASQIINLIKSSLEEKYGEKFTDNLYKINLTGKVPEDLIIDSVSISREIMNTLYYAKVTDSTRPDIDIQVLSADFSLKGLFVKKMLAKINSCNTEDEKKIYTDALYLGLQAFDGEVCSYED